MLFLTTKSIKLAPQNRQTILFGNTADKSSVVCCFLNMYFSLIQLLQIYKHSQNPSQVQNGPSWQQDNESKKLRTFPHISNLAKGYEMQTSAAEYKCLGSLHPGQGYSCQKTFAVLAAQACEAGAPLLYWICRLLMLPVTTAGLTVY